MHIEDIFEDLEAQFDAAMQKSQRDSFTQNIRALEINTITQMKKDLIAPIIGNQFLAGLDSVSPVWHVYPMRVIRNVTFHSEIDESLPKLRTLSVSLERFIDSIPKPCSIRWRVAFAEDFLHTGQLHSATSSLLFIYTIGSVRPIAVPIAALEQLIIESVDNLNGDF